MNYVNAWKIFHKLVLLLVHKSETDLASLHRRFDRLANRSRVWCISTQNTEVYAIRQEIEDLLYSLNGVQCQHCQAPLAAYDVYYMSIKSCAVCEEEGYSRAIEQDLYCKEAGLDARSMLPLEN